MSKVQSEKHQGETTLVMNAPRIGLTVKRGRDYNHPKNRFYIARLEEAGAEVVLFRPDELAGWRERAATLDGLVLGGGGDVHPRRYGEPLNGTYLDSIDEDRDALEMDLLRMCLERDLPVLAICRGIQVLNVALGGRLLQHLPGHQPLDGEALTHAVRVRAGSRLWTALGEMDTLVVNSYHHQGIAPDGLAPSLVASAWAETDGLIEGVESLNHRWVVGVQWHPERIHDFPPPSRAAQRRLFHTFVQVSKGEPVAV